MQTKSAKTIKIKAQPYRRILKRTRVVPRNLTVLFFSNRNDLACHVHVSNIKRQRNHVSEQTTRYKTLFIIIMYMKYK